MIITVEELKTLISTDKSDNALQMLLEGIEAFVVKYTNNDFKDRTTGVVSYPACVKQTVVDIVAWKLRNETMNGTDTDGKPVSSETISRHSVTYASDATESDIDSRTGYPKKYTAVLDLYKRARF